MRGRVCVVACVAVIGCGDVAPSPVARVLAVDGSVERERAGAWRSAGGGDSLFRGNALRTGEASSAHVRTTGSDVELRVHERSLVRFGRGAAAPIAVERGRADLDVGDAGAVVELDFGTARLAPNTRVAIRAGDGRVRVRVSFGAARVTARTGAVAELFASDDVVIRRATGQVVPPAPVGVDAGASAGESTDVASLGGGLLPVDVVVAAGESVTVHDPRPPTAVRIDVADACESGATARVTGAAWRDDARTALDAGTHRYAVLCGETSEPAAVGTIAVVRDAATRPAGRNLQTNRVDADGRTYTIEYAGTHPPIEFRWPGAPARGTYQLVLARARGRDVERTLERPAHVAKAGSLRDGEYAFRFSSGSRTSRVSTLTLAAESPAQVYLESPRPRSRWARDAVTIAGVAPVGSTVTVAGERVAVGPRGKFRVRVARAHASGGALAVRVERAARIDYYVRRARRRPQ